MLDERHKKVSIRTSWRLEKILPFDLSIRLDLDLH